MVARLGIVIACTAVAMAAVATVVASAGAAPGGPAGQTVAAKRRPVGVVLDCSSQQGLGAGISMFSSRWNLVVGPLAIPRAGGSPPAYAQSVVGDKFAVFVKGGRRVTIELSQRTRRGVGLFYGPPPERGWDFRNAYRVVTFIACRRGEISGRFDGWPVSFWDGFVMARSPRCVPLSIWIDDEPSPRRAVIRLGVRSCE